MLRQLGNWEVQDSTVSFHIGISREFIIVEMDADVDYSGVGVTETTISDRHGGCISATSEKTYPLVLCLLYIRAVQYD